MLLIVVFLTSAWCVIIYQQLSLERPWYAPEWPLALGLPCVPTPYTAEGSLDPRGTMLSEGGALCVVTKQARVRWIF